jgi:hypothetical protein
VKNLALLLLLSGCCLVSAPDPPLPTPPPSVPDNLKTCPAKAPAPTAPPRILTTGRLQDAYHALDLALQGADRRGDVCAERLQELNQWIKSSR